MATFQLLGNHHRRIQQICFDLTGKAFCTLNIVNADERWQRNEVSSVAGDDGRFIFGNTQEISNIMPFLKRGAIVPTGYDQRRLPAHECAMNKQSRPAWEV